MSMKCEFSEYPPESPPSRRQDKEWLGRELPPWRDPCPIEQDNEDDHHKTGRLEVGVLINEMDLSWLSGNVVKYLARHRHKGKGKIDLLKALDYLCKEMRSNHSYTKEEIEEVIGRHFGKWK